MRQNPFTGRSAPTVLTRKAMAKAIAAAVATLAASGAANAVQFDTGNPDSQLTWYNTVKYSAAARVRSQNASVADNSIGPQANTNDGDLNFGKGLISTRLDVRSELEYRYKREFGARISAAGWYDEVYNRRNVSVKLIRPNLPNKILSMRWVQLNLITKNILKLICRVLLSGLLGQEWAEIYCLSRVRVKAKVNSH